MRPVDVLLQLVLLVFLSLVSAVVLLRVRKVTLRLRQHGSIVVVVVVVVVVAVVAVVAVVVLVCRRRRRC